jgi:hypothetical protein
MSIEVWAIKVLFIAGTSSKTGIEVRSLALVIGSPDELPGVAARSLECGSLREITGST